MYTQLYEPACGPVICSVIVAESGQPLFSLLPRTTVIHNRHHEAENVAALVKLPFRYPNPIQHYDRYAYSCCGQSICSGNDSYI
jgi:hypothetical protein